MYCGKYTSRIHCPFFIREAGKEITCVGIEPETLYSIKFNSTEEKVAFQEKHCLHEAQRCGIMLGLEKLS